MAILSLAPFVKWAAWDDDANPASGFQLFCYQAGTAIKQATYTDVSGSSANTNPIILDAAGRATIYLLNNASYKFVLAPPTDTDPPTSPIWTQDDINSDSSGSGGNMDVSGTAGENQTAGDFCYVSQGDGGLTPGQWYKTDSDVDYSTLNAIQVGFAINTVTLGQSNTYRTGGLMTGLAGLVAGTTYFASSTAGALSTAAGTYPRKAGVGASATSLYVASGENAAGLVNAGNISAVDQTIKGPKTFTESPIVTIGAGIKTGRVPVISSTSGATVTTSAPATSTVLAQTLCLANTLSVDGASIYGMAWGYFAATANAKLVNLIWGVLGSAPDVFSYTASPNNKTWILEFRIARTTASTQHSWVRFTLGGSPVNTTSAAVIVETREQSRNDLSQDLTAELVAQIRATDTTAAGGTVCLGHWMQYGQKT